MRKQFNLEYYLKHPETKVVTRDGRDVRILCTDLRSNNYPIVAACLSFNRDEDEVNTYTSEGKSVSGSSLEYSRDLLFDIPDPIINREPLTYEDLLERVKSGKTMWIINDRGIVFNIVDFDFDNVYYIYGSYKEIIPDSYEEAMKGMVFVNGDPTWKEVEE